MESTQAHKQLLWKNVWKKIKDSHAVVEGHPGYGESWKKIKEMWSVIGWSQNEKPDVQVPSVPERVSIENALSYEQPLEEIPSITHTWELNTQSRRTPRFGRWTPNISCANNQIYIQTLLAEKTTLGSSQRPCFPQTFHEQ